MDTEVAYYSIDVDSEASAPETPRPRRRSTQRLARQAEKSSDPLLNTSFGRYRLLSPLGKGGYGRVYKAWDPQLERHVAIKVLSRRDKKAYLRFAREITTTARLNHPNVVGIHDSGASAGRPYLVMELVEGESAWDLGQSDQAPGPEEAARLMAQVARAIQHAHERGVLHRDLKPANILITASGHAYVLDFGLARHTTHGRLTQTGAVLGTPLFMAPEQSRGSDQISERSDVYGLAATFYYLLTGRPPHVADSVDQLLDCLLNEPEPPSAHAPGVAPALDALVLRGLQASPDKRFPSAQAFAEALEAWLEGDAPAARPLPGAWGALHTPRVLGLALAASLCFGLALGLLFGGGSSPEAPTPAATTAAAVRPDPATPAAAARAAAAQRAGFDEVYPLYERALTEATPEAAAGLRLELAQLALRRNRVEQALGLLRDASTREQLAWKAFAALQARDKAELTDALTRLAADPEGRVFASALVEPDRQQAGFLALCALRRDPSWWPAELILAEAALRSGASEARQVLAPLLSAHPDHVPALTLDARCLTRLSRRREALAALEVARALASPHLDPRALLLEGALALGFGADPLDVAADFARARAAGLDDPTLHLWWGTALLLGDDERAAKPHLSKARKLSTARILSELADVDLDPTVFRLLDKELGLISSLDPARPSDALRDALQTGLGELPDRAREPLLRARLLAAGAEARGPLEAACAAALKAAPRSGAVALEAARLLTGRDAYAAAQRALGAARTLGAPRSDADRLEAELLWRQGREVAALRALGELAERDSGVASRWARSLTAYLRGDLARAEREAKEALGLSPSDAPSRLLLALVQAGQGEPLQALTSCAEVHRQQGYLDSLLAAAVVSAGARGAAGGALDEDLALLAPRLNEVLRGADGAFARVEASRLALGSSAHVLAGSWLAEALRTEPDRAQVLLLQGAQLLGRGSAQDVLAVWSRAREVDPALPLPAAYARRYAERFGDLGPLESLFQ
ncbi:MAG: protein kinase [Planctomycetota bacterium]